MCREDRELPQSSVRLLELDGEVHGPMIPSIDGACAERAGRAIMEPMTLHMSEAEVARDLHAVLAKVQQGVEVVIEQDRRPVAVLRAPLANGRLLSDCIALAEARGTSAIPDEGFMRDVAEGIAERTKPWTPRSWK